jgi:metal transporter CNNM
MPPARWRTVGPHSTRLIYTFFSITTQWLPKVLRGLLGSSIGIDLSQSWEFGEGLAKRAEFNPHEPKYIVFAVLIPVLVLLSGLFAGLTLGYMSLDETQLNVLSLSGTPYVQT